MGDAQTFWAVVIVVGYLLGNRALSRLERGHLERRFAPSYKRDRRT